MLNNGISDHIDQTPVLTLVRMQGEEGDPDYLVWEHSLAMNGDEDLIMGKNSKTDRHSYLSKAFRMEGHTEFCAQFYWAQRTM